jgi:DNA-binding LacI/PurR family transcriptional regulator
VTQRTALFGGELNRVGGELNRVGGELNQGNPICLLLNAKLCAYSRAFRTQVLAQARSQDFEATVLEVDLPPDPVTASGAAVDEVLRRCSEFQGAVLLSSVFSHKVGGLSRFAQHWAPRPLVSVGYVLPGVASVIVDNRGAERLATAHLIDQHDRRRLLYVRGRKDSLEAKERYLGYRRALHERGILFDNALVVQGDFTTESAVRALSTVPLDLKFDGVVAANDVMALAVVNELKRRGIYVPKDISIIGFDDVEEARSAPIPLSSMAQPFEALAREALLSVRRQLRGARIQSTVTVPVKLVMRLSCGCEETAPRPRASNSGS